MGLETNDLVAMLGIISSATFPFISPQLRPFLIFHASHSSHLLPSLHPLLICVYTLKVFIVGVPAAQRSELASLCEVLPQRLDLSKCVFKNDASSAAYYTAIMLSGL